MSPLHPDLPAPDHDPGRRGAAFIEILTAIAIFGIVLTAVFATFTFQAQSYTTQNRVAEMQENLRVAADTLLRDVRMGGYGLNSDVNVPATEVGATGTTVALRGFYTGDGGSSAPDNIYILYAYDMDNTVAALQPTLTTGMVTANGPVTVNVTPGTGTRFPVGDLLVLSNGSTADLYRVTARDNTSITFGADIYNNASAHPAAYVYDAGSKVSFARFVRYSIDSTTDPAHPALMQQRLPGAATQPVADDIEDLQFAYGLAATVDNAVVSTTANSMLVSQLPLLRRIQVSVIARSRLPETGWQGQRMNIGNRTGTPPADRYRRRVFENLAVDIRNTRLN